MINPLHIISNDDFKLFCTKLNTLLMDGTNGQYRRKANWLSAQIAKALPNTTDNFNINTLKNILKHNELTTILDTPLGANMGTLREPILQPMCKSCQPFTYDSYHDTTLENKMKDVGFVKEVNGTDGYSFGLSLELPIAPDGYIPGALYASLSFYLEPDDEVKDDNVHLTLYIDDINKDFYSLEDLSITSVNEFMWDEEHHHTYKEMLALNKKETTLFINKVIKATQTLMSTKR